MDIMIDEEEDEEMISMENFDFEMEDELFYFQKDEYFKSIFLKDLIGEDKFRLRGGECFDKNYDMDDDELNNIFDIFGLK